MNNCVFCNSELTIDKYPAHDSNPVMGSESAYIESIYCPACGLKYEKLPKRTSDVLADNEEQQLIDVFGIRCNPCGRWFWIQAPHRIEADEWVSCPICCRKLIGAVDGYIQLGAVDYVVKPPGPRWSLSGHNVRVDSRITEPDKPAEKEDD